MDPKFAILVGKMVDFLKTRPNSMASMSDIGNSGMVQPHWKRWQQSTWLSKGTKLKAFIGQFPALFRVVTDKNLPAVILLVPHWQPGPDAIEPEPEQLTAAQRSAMPKPKAVVPLTAAQRSALPAAAAAGALPTPKDPGKIVDTGFWGSRGLRGRW